jgi:high-affinity iron transporter
MIGLMLKTIFNSACVLLALGAVLAAPRLARADEATAVGDLRTQQVAALVDYVAADYPQAVQDGKVLEPTEYAEQQNLLDEARKLAEKLTAPDAGAQKQLLDQIASVRAAVDEKAPGSVVQVRCRSARQTLKDAFKLRMIPSVAPDAVRAAALFKSVCATCHGADGRADTPAAQQLKPPPVSFHDGQRMPVVAPALAYHTLTFGVPGTPMVSFDQLPAHERWSLAFYVLALRHGTPGAPSQLPESERQSAAVQKLSNLADLAELSDQELVTELGRAGLDAAAQQRALIHLRTSAPFLSGGGNAVAGHAGGARFDKARALLAQVQAAAQAGEQARAHQLSIAAYLDGIEPHEATLKTQQPKMVPRIEQAFMALRLATDEAGGARLDAAEVGRRVQAATLLLDEAERVSAGTGTVAAFVAALTIALREGLEVALLIAALLAFLRKSGQGQLTRLVHYGWALALPAGLLTFVLVGALISGAQRELAEAVMTFFAAAILITMTHWVIGAKEARSWLGFLRRHVEAAGDKGRSGELRQKVALLGLAFFAVYREALETVLFYRSLLLNAGPGGWKQVLGGALLGAALMVAVVLVVGRIGRRLNPRPVMLASSVLLALLALSMTGNGVHALQEGGYLRFTPILIGGSPWAGVPVLGLHASWQGVLLQLAVVLLLFLPSLLQRLRRREPPAQVLPNKSGALLA